MLKQLRRLYHRLCWHAEDAYYWLRARVWEPYNVVKIKTLSPTWHDRDLILLHAAFQILVDFIEQEKPSEWFDIENSWWEDDWNELFALYTWWKECGKDNCDEDEQRAENTAKLIRLIELRGHLWT